MKSILIKQILCGLLLLLSINFISAQTKFTKEELAVKAIVDQLFDGMRAGDSTMVRATFHKTATLVTTFTNKKGNKVLEHGKISQFINAVGTPHDKVWDERISSYTIQINGNLASVWTDYEFYAGEKFSHCGVNSFQLFQSNEGWKIINITDTRHRSSCTAFAKKSINEFLDAWHQAATTANAVTFFGSMTKDCIYIGTDATERWLRDELKSWSAKAFERDTAWAFTPIERAVYMGDNKTVWFDETLDTWMGICRGSGVLTLTPEGWKIRHYHLSVTIPNDLIKGFIELVKKGK